MLRIPIPTRLWAGMRWRRPSHPDRYFVLEIVDVTHECIEYVFYHTDRGDSPRIGVVSRPAQANRRAFLHRLVICAYTRWRAP